MSDIVQFLLARIAEDERLVKIAVASSTVPTGLSEADIFWRWGYAARNGFSSYVEGAPPTPPRVLAECKAKRELVELINGVDAAEFYHADQSAPVREPYMRPDVAEGLLRIMAQPYADRPDFEAEWKLEQ